MRLIDADATIPMIKYATTDNEIGIFPIKIGHDDIVKVLKAQPTVEAIPIEWLQAKADSWNAELKTACPEDAETIRHIQQKYLGIIEEWRREE